MLAILCLGLVMRVATGIDRPLWWDDLHSLFYALQSPDDLWKGLSLTQYRPLYFLLVQPLADFREHVLVLRLPGIVSSLAALVAATTLVRVLAGDRAAGLSALALACAATPLLYANEIRFYGLQSALLLWGAALLVEQGTAGRSWRPLVAGLATGLALMTATFSLLWIPGQCLLAWIRAPRDRRSRSLALFLAALAPFLILALLDLSRMSGGMSSQSMNSVFSKPGFSTLAGWIKHALVGPIPFQDGTPARNLLLGAGLFITASGLGAWWLLPRERRPLLAAYTAWILLPSIALIAYSHLRLPIYQHRYLLPSGTLLAAMAAAGLVLLPGRRFGVATLLLLVTILPGTLIYATHPSAYEILDRDESDFSGQVFRPEDSARLAPLLNADDVLVADGIVTWLDLLIYPPGPQRLLLRDHLESAHLWAYHPFLDSAAMAPSDTDLFSLPAASARDATDSGYPRRPSYVIVSNDPRLASTGWTASTQSWNGHRLYRPPH